MAIKKFLCVCQYGHSRSVAMVRALHRRGHAAVAIGYKTSGDVVGVLSEWADLVVVMDDYMIAYVPAAYKHKLRVCAVGPDIWSNPYNPDLAALVEKFVPNLEL